MSELPKGWRSATIREATSYVQRGKSPQYVERSELPVVNQKCVRWNGVEADHLKFVAPEQWDAWSDERTLRSGDVLWNSTGTGTIGRAAIFRPIAGFERVVADSHVTVLRPSHVLPELLHAWIRSPVVQSRIDEMQTGSTNQVELSRAEVLATTIPLPPRNEQRRIVAKLEALQARSRRAREALESVPALLEKLRQSILAAAFRGDLTKEWREKHPDVEPAEKLLARIRVERRKKWEEAELAKLVAKGKAPKDDRWKERYEEPKGVDTKGLPELPKMWCWASSEEVVAEDADIVYGIVQPGPAVSEGVPYVRGMDIQDGAILEGQLLRTTATIAQRYARASLRGGDVLLGIIRATKVAVVPESLTGANITQGTARFRPGRCITTEYLATWLDSPFAQDWLHAHYRGIDMPGLNLQDVRRLPVPLAPLQEQRETVVEVGLRVRGWRHCRETCFAVELQTQELERAILAKAFRGELVPQDPNDEPVSLDAPSPADGDDEPAAAPTRSRATAKRGARKRASR